MSVKKLSPAILGVAIAMAYPIVAKDKPKPSAEGGTVTAVLWQNPADIANRDLYYGPGGRPHEPHGTFAFVKEDLEGTNPKFVVRDQDGIEWKVKLGIEARPETVASRIVWAAGYYANEDYFMPVLEVQGMPAKLHRGNKLIEAGGTVRNVRLKRQLKSDKKVGTWEWRSNPFVGTRELNGLKTLMAVINNWDLKDENNAIYRVGPERVYTVSDLGASFGTDGRAWPYERGKGNLDSYERSGFVRNETGDLVDFRVPARPQWVFVVNPKEYFQRRGLEWIGHGIPREDARWMGEVLTHLSDHQIRDAFRSAGYMPSEVDAFSQVLERRIAALTDL